jgi:acetyltransferase-like isoleucine patch superfamily enzyme
MSDVAVHGEVPDDSAALWIHPTASVSPDARIHASTRGSRMRIGAHTFIYDFVVLRAVGGSGDLVIGEHCYINPGTTIYSGSGVQLGDYVLIGPGCVIAPANHAYSRRDVPIRHQGFMPSRGGVVIEDDVWLGANCTLLDGTRIGQGAIIAAGAVVHGEVEPYAIYGGVPAKKIGQRGES